MVSSAGNSFNFETSHFSLLLVILADDMTGALDTGVQFSKKGASVALTLPESLHVPPDTQVLVIDAETRHLPPEDAWRVIRDLSSWARQAGASYLYLKTDSGLRGNIGPSLKGMLDGAGGGTISFAPAYPQMGRVTRNGQQYVDGLLIENSVFGQDPVNPVTSSDIAGLITWEGVQALNVPRGAEIPNDQTANVLIYDAETDADLSQIARNLKTRGLLRLTAGCAAFSQALIPAFGLPDLPALAPRIQPPLLVVCGSLNAITRRQLKHGVQHGAWRGTLDSGHLISDHWEKDSSETLQEARSRMKAGQNVLIDTDGSVSGGDPVATSQLIASRMGEVIGKLLSMREAAGYTLMVIGGDTLMGFLRGKDIANLQFEGEVTPGVVAFHFVHEGRRIRMLSKSGGFGPETLLTDVMEAAAEAAERA